MSAQGSMRKVDVTGWARPSGGAGREPVRGGVHPVTGDPRACARTGRPVVIAGEWRVSGRSAADRPAPGGAGAGRPVPGRRPVGRSRACLGPGHRSRVLRRRRAASGRGERVLVGLAVTLCAAAVVVVLGLVADLAGAAHGAQPEQATVSAVP